MDKKLVYSNLANGVSVEAVSAAFEISPQAVTATFKEVGLQLAGHMVHEATPYVPCQTVEAARANRVKLLPMLAGLELTDTPRYRRVSVRHVAANAVAR